MPSDTSNRASGLQPRCKLGKFSFSPVRVFREGDFGLSAREIQTLTLILEEIPLREIATRMEVSMHTVDTFKRRLFEKLGVTTLAGAAAVATAHLAGMALVQQDNTA
ncbi:LuxR C-terminal-related transcriptional regulator [Henriciella aquimarina]|uniref:LuxR C-terminal-related transcriptional regulator n=1 Tax=Henriciella aquimarina TaxID=545261 RepID=UPI0009FEC564|nr:LuxR C-terminal-related transcriptional regulator [Henriciella aquimarina]